MTSTVGLYFRMHSALAPSLNRCSYHCSVSIHVCFKSPWPGGACAHWNSLSTEELNRRGLLPWRHCMVELSTLCETMKPSFWMLGSAPQHLFSSFYPHKLWRVFAPRSLSCSYQQLNLPFCACLPGTIGSIDSGNNVQVSFYVVQQAPSCLCVYIS